MALTGHHLLIATELWVPYFIFPKDPEAPMSGVLYDLLTIIQLRYNFTYTFVRADGGVWGNKMPNGSFNGMMGQMQRKEVDMALGPFSQTYDRYGVVDFSEPVVGDEFSIIMPRPTAEKNLTGFLRPFTLTVWGLLLVSAFATVLVGWILQATANKARVYAPQPSINNGDLRTLVFKSSWVLRSLFLDSIEKLPDVLTGRVILGTWFVTALVLSAAYSGALTSILTVPIIKIPIDSLLDLLHSDMKYNVESGTALQNELTNSESGIMMEIGKRVGIISYMYTSRHDMLVNNYAVMCDQTTMKQVISEEYSVNASCSYYIAKNRIKTAYLGLIFHKKSVYQPYFDESLAHLKAGGFIDKLMASYIVNATACLVSPGKEPGQSKMAAYNMEDMGGMFLILVGGYGMAFTSFLGENLWHLFVRKWASQE